MFATAPGTPSQSASSQSSTKTSAKSRSSQTCRSRHGPRACMAMVTWCAATDYTGLTFGDAGARHIHEGEIHRHLQITRVQNFQMMPCHDACPAFPRLRVRASLFGPMPFSRAMAAKRLLMKSVDNIATYSSCTGPSLKPEVCSQSPIVKPQSFKTSRFFSEGFEDGMVPGEWADSNRICDHDRLSQQP